MERDKDTLRILVSTDNHVGYLESDPLRGQDSFTAFEEMLQVAVAEEVIPFWALVVHATNKAR